MKFQDAFLLGANGLGRHWGRAALNASGILAGVGSIVILLGVAQAVGRASHAAVERLGADLVVVYPSGVSSSGVQTGFGPGNTLSIDDVRALNDQAYVPDATDAVPTAGMRAGVNALAQLWQTDLIGTTDGFAAARGYSISQGRFFNASEDSVAASVVVVGQTVANNLFPTANPIGQVVRINNHPFTVVGEFAARGYTGSYNQDDLAVMPITSAWAYVLPTATPRVEQVFVTATSPGATTAVKAEITNTLLQRHHIRNPSLADFQVQTQQDLVTSAQKMGNLMTWMLAAIAVISLGTGAIAITTLMLASVRERAHEIGIRRAVGASRPAIMGQFLFEALLLAAIGGAVGIAFGIGAATVVGSLITDVPAPIITPTAVAVAAAIALLVGLASGLYPAARAAVMVPAEALRR